MTAIQTRPARLRDRGSVLLFGILGAGLALRIVLPAVLNPMNRDSAAHFEVMKYIARTHTVPGPYWNGQSYHPMLYHLLFSPFVGWGPRGIQLLQVPLALGGLLLLYALTTRHRIFGSSLGAITAFTIAAFTPPVVAYGELITNDSLALFLGLAVSLAIPLVVDNYGRQRALVAAFLCGLGLMTKTTFVAWLPGIWMALCLGQVRRKIAVAKAMLFSTLWVLLAAGIGMGRLTENAIETGNPAFSALQLDMPWVRAQSGSSRGWKSWVDVDVRKLLSSPKVSDETEHSFPLLLFGTFWYPHMGETSLVGQDQESLRNIGRALYLLGIAPLLAGAIGLIEILRGSASGASQADSRTTVLRVFVVAMTFNLSIVLVAMARHDVWSILHARLLFTTLTGLLATVAVGVDRMCENRVLRQFWRCWLAAFIAVVAAFWASEGWARVELVFGRFR